MKLATPITLALTVLTAHLANACQNCCNENTNCCEEQPDCCEEKPDGWCCCETASDSCTTRGSSCCSRCQIRCRTPTCRTRCNQDCCYDSCNNNNCPRDCPKPVPRTTSTARPHITPRFEPIPIPPTNSSNHNVNNANISATFNVNNTVSITNYVRIPVNISNVNINTVHIIPSRSDQYTTTRRTASSIDVTDHPPITNPTSTPITPVTVIVKVPVPVPVPKPVFIPVPFPVRIPYPVYVRGCCLIFTPCITDYCTPYYRTCDQSCTYPFMYTPFNPCQDGCYKRQFSSGTSCYGSQYCQRNHVDCRGCDENFYESYEEYRRCGSCFYA